MFGRKKSGGRPNRSRFNKSSSSSRPVYFRQKRSQKVRFRSRYASSLLKNTGLIVFQLLKIGIVLGSLGVGSFYSWSFWKTSTLFQVKAVQFEGELPQALIENFPIQKGNHILKIHPSQLEVDFKKQFPVLSSFSIHRQINKTVVVTGKFRAPIAMLQEGGVNKGLDSNGIIFPLEVGMSVEGYPLIDGKVESPSMKRLAEALSQIQKESPKFFLLLKKIKTDKIPTIQFELSDGVLVDWPRIIGQDVRETSEGLLAFRDQYEPFKMPAKITVISKDRIVMDANWKPKFNSHS